MQNDSTTALARHRTLLLGLAVLLPWGAAPAAQTGAFRDGELLAFGPDAVSGFQSIVRIDAATGDGEPFVERVILNYLEPGGLVYDPFREAVLYYGSQDDFGIFLPRLFQVDASGNLTDLGFRDERLGQFAPVGDGRVYLRRQGVLYLLDPSDQLVPVVDEFDQPISLELEQMAFDPGTNSLVGVATAFSVNPCSGAGFEITVHRLSLDPSGTKLAGPIDCDVLPTLGVLSVLGIDALPEGQLLVTLAGGQVSSERIALQVDPVSLAVSTEVALSYNDLDGGVWCQRIGRTVVFDDVANELRSYAPGDSGSGQLLPVDLALGDSTTGVSSRNTLTDIDLLGPGCGGLAYEFGQGLAGAGGVVPRLDAMSCPAIGTTVQLRVSGGIGGGVGVLLGGQATFAYGALGGTGYVLPPFDLQVLVPLGGAAGSPGQGAGLVPVAVPADASLLGRDFYFQAGVVDSSAPANVSLTQALEVRLG